MSLPTLSFLRQNRFFVRHAYFTGANQPYEKLKRALKAEINESAWSALNTNVSRPFDPPNQNGRSGKIAVKVTNHYGDEGLFLGSISFQCLEKLIAPWHNDQLEPSYLLG
ncbi:hypothetical protein [Phormidesmis priestleyi]|uniref:hypothetical protein n=1 Tax=Phormidesmis priestleyi TaxID=268141 RepID=UPI00083B3F7F|nr:hypothetical protein [Phormidesmis priestleyi]